MKQLVISLSLASICSGVPSVAQAAGDWEPIRDEEGINVWRREVAGSDLVEFRGKAVVEGSLRAVTAVLHDVGRQTEWMRNCSQAFPLQLRSVLSAVIYNRTRSEYVFVSDRDAVLEAVIRPRPESRSVTVDFRTISHPGAPPVDGVVRMPNLRGHWELVRLTPERTLVTYELRADPGGAIPSWLVNLVAKVIPFDTIRNLRAQVKAGGYERNARLLDAAIAWDEFAAASPPSEPPRAP